MQVQPKHIISAIIGMWRCGAKVYEIIDATGHAGNTVEMIIEIYKSNLKQTNDNDQLHH